MTGKSSVMPLKIKKCLLYSDSSICLSWLRSHSKVETNKKPVFITNRLVAIEKLCQKCPIMFGFC